MMGIGLGASASYPEWQGAVRQVRLESRCGGL